MPCDALSFCDLFKRKRPTQRLKTAKKSFLRSFWTLNPNFLAIMSHWLGHLGLKRLRKAQTSHDKPRGPTQQLKTAEKLGFWVQNGHKIDFLAVLSLWVGSLAFERVAERPGITWHRSGHPTCPYFEEKKNWPKMRYQKLGFGVHNGRKNDFFAVLSLWVGPFRLKRSQKDRASHGIALDTPHAYILKKKIGQKRDPQIWDLGSGMAQKWSKTIQMPIICMKSSYLTNYYPHFIDFKMLRLIWTKMAETP